MRKLTDGPLSFHTDEYRKELEKELEDLKSGRQSLYTERRIKTLETRLAQMGKAE